VSLLAVTSDPAAWIVFATLVGAAVGFFCTALFAGRRIREERAESYWEGYGACNRAHSMNHSAAASHDSSDSHSSHSEEMRAMGFMGSMGEDLKRP
jgi:hypothetical protein